MKADPADFACTCTEPHYVYRCYDADDRLIYVGMARDPKHRFLTHKRSHPEVFERTVRREVVEYPDRAHALAAEAEAIANEKPLLNKHHKGARYGGSKVQATDEELRAIVRALPPIHA